MKSKYIDIHTHGKTGNGNVLEIVNLFPEEKTVSGGYFSMGLHPWNIKEDQLESDFEYLALKCEDEKILAVGECGFDKLKGPSIELQSRIFERHCELSEKLSKPLIIHCVKAYDEIISFRKIFKPSCAWIIHGFNKTPETAMQLVNAGFHLSFGTSIKNENSKTAEALKIIPGETVFFETDDSGADICGIYMAAAEIMGTSVEKIKETIKYNVEKIFRIKI